MITMIITMLATGVAKRLGHDAMHRLHHYDILETQVCALLTLT
jgi:hypothetical protein